jgi:putative ABC transport system permease protein
MLDPVRLYRRARSLLTTRQFDDDLDEEMRFHLEMETQRRVNAGMDERRARDSARRDFGVVSKHRDDARDARGVRPIEDVLKDVRVSLRRLVKQRTYATVAILTLAIGIGATTALWAAVYRVLLAPYPFVEADRIVSVQEHDRRTPQVLEEVAPANYLDIKARSRSFDLLGIIEPWGTAWIAPEGPENFGAALVTADVFAIQGLRPIIGRIFTPDEFAAGRDHVVLLSEELWRRRFGADSTLIGRTLVLDSIPRTVVGVMPVDALHPYAEELWLPKVFRGDENSQRRNGWWTVIGRMAPGVTIDRAHQELDGIASQLAAEHPATNRHTGLAVRTLRDALAGEARGGLLVLFGAVAFVLLIACVNVANLELAECIRRQRELAIRTAIGAGRGRLVRQLLTESAVLAVIGATAGLAIAYWGIHAIRAFAPDDLWQLKRLSFDASAMLFAFGLSLFAAVTIAVMPMIAASRIRLGEALAAGARSGGGLRRRRANRLLVVSEVALAVVLLVGAGLLVRSLGTLLQVHRGFRADGVLVATLQAWGYYPTPRHRAEFVRLASERLAALPGVQTVGMTSSLPLDYPIGFEKTHVQVEGHVTAPGDEEPMVRVAAVTNGFFDVLEIPLVQGRALLSTDVAGSTPVALVNRAFARRYFGDGNPIGKRVTVGFMGPPVAREIVGVIGDVRHDGLHADPLPSTYVPHAQASTGAIHFVLRTGGEPMTLERVVRAEVRLLNGAMPLSKITTMDALLSRSLRERRFQLALLVAFSIIALTLSAIGIYGVMSRITSERTHEIGVRMAIGAHASDVRWMVFRNGSRLAIIGVVIGTVGALLLSRYMKGMLFGVTPLDPITYLAAASVLLLSAVLATWLPARRAAGVDPVVALRSD